MKKCLALSIALILTGCGSDDSNDNTQSRPDYAITTINGTQTNEVSLPATSLEQIAAENVAISDITSTTRPNISDLNNIEILDGYLVNNTPYEINQIILTNGTETKLLSLTSSLPKYSKGAIGSAWNGYQLYNQTVLSNSTFEYESTDVLTNYPNSVLANDEERLTGELTQIYDRFMINAPETLAEITEHLTEICSVNSECDEYSKPVEYYAADTYYAKSVSGTNSRLWIDTDVWGLASLLSLNYTTSTRSSSNLNIWMHPVLMSYVHNENTNTQIEGWQALVHEYYHNHGFGHASGWASGNGIDDIFGAKVVNDYYPNNGNRMILSDIIVMEQSKPARLTYTFDLALTGNSNTITTRLLSTKELEAKVTRNGSQITVKFADIPETHVYVSFFTENSKQMTSLVLSKFTRNVYTNAEIQSFNDNISEWLSEYDVINVTTGNGAWYSEFHLPSTNVGQGKIVNFVTNAYYSSTVYYDGNGDLLTTGDKASYQFNGTIWEKL